MSENMTIDMEKDQDNGQITYANEVISTIVSVATTEVEGISGIVGATSMAGIIGKGRTPRGVRVDMDGQDVNVDVSVTVDYGMPIQKVGRNAQENVRKERLNRSLRLHASGDLRLLDQRLLPSRLIRLRILQHAVHKRQRFFSFFFQAFARLLHRLRGKRLRGNHLDHHRNGRRLRMTAPCITARRQKRKQRRARKRARAEHTSFPFHLISSPQQH